MHQLAADGVKLHVLDDDRACAAGDLQVDERSGPDQHAAKLAGIGRERDAFPVGAAVDDAGHLAGLAQAACYARAEFLAGLNFY